MMTKPMRGLELGVLAEVVKSEKRGCSDCGLPEIWPDPERLPTERRPDHPDSVS